MGVGPFQANEQVRIPLEVVLNGKAVSVNNPRIQRLIMPNGSDAPNYPKAMARLKDGTYIYEFYVFDTGNYTAILQAEYGTKTIEQIESFVVEKPLMSYPRIEVASDE